MRTIPFMGKKRELWSDKCRLSVRTRGKLVKAYNPKKILKTLPVVKINGGITYKRYVNAFKYDEQKQTTGKRFRSIEFSSKGKWYKGRNSNWCRFTWSVWWLGGGVVCEWHAKNFIITEWWQWQENIFIFNATFYTGLYKQSLYRREVVYGRVIPDGCYHAIFCTIVAIYSVSCQ